MGSRTLGLHTVGRGGIAPRTTSLTYHVLTSSSAQYLFAFICTGLSSSYLMSSGATYGPIFSFRPFIPTITPPNPTLSILKEKWEFNFTQAYFPHTYVISSRVGVFSPAKEHAPDASTSGTPQHLLRTAPYPPRSTM